MGVEKLNVWRNPSVAHGMRSLANTRPRGIDVKRNRIYFLISRILCWTVNGKALPVFFSATASRFLLNRFFLGFEQKAEEHKNGKDSLKTEIVR